MSSIKAKLLLILSSIGVVLLITAANGWISLDHSHNRIAGIYKDRVIPLQTLKTVADAYAVDIVDTTHKVRADLLDWGSGAASVEQAQAEIRAQWQAYLQTTLTREEAQLAENAQGVMDNADRAVEDLKRLLQSGDKTALDGFAEKQLYAAIDPVSSAIDALIRLQLEVAGQDYASNEADFDQARWLMGLLIVIGLAAIGFGLYTVLRGIVGPLHSIGEIMQRLAQDDLAVEVAGADRKDEIGHMAKTVQFFKDSLIQGKEQAAQQDRERAEAMERNRRLEELTQKFDEAVAGVIAEVGAATQEMQGTAASMSATAEETNRQASAVAAASEEASTNVQTVASAAEELSASIEEIGRQVAQSATITAKASVDAERTNAQVDGLAQAAQKIGEVVSMIKDIAEQTNLLALNATIEAARAGEAGKGFAVVASEVKSLASQTARATEQIGKQIGGIQSETNDAVSAIQGIGKTIAEIDEIATTIAAAVEEQGAATQEISRNVQEAARGTQDVSSNIGGVTRAAGDTGIAAEQVNRSAGNLASQSDQLRHAVEEFLKGVRAA